MVTFNSTTPGGVFTFDGDTVSPSGGITNSITDVTVVLDTEGTLEDTYNIVITFTDGSMTTHPFTVRHGAVTDLYVNSGTYDPNTQSLTLTLTDGTEAVVISGIASGMQGIQGERGERGERGATGLAGANGDDGLGWTSGAYNSSNGTVTFSSDDGLGFTTGDLRGADGANGINGVAGAPGTPGVNGNGWTGGSYDDTTGIVTFTSNDGLGFVTEDLRGAAGTEGPEGPEGPMGPRGADGGGVGTFDDVPTINSQQAARSGGIFAADQALQANIDAEETARMAADAAIESSKQDSNIVVDNAAARLALDPNDHERGTLVIEEDTGEIYYIDASGAQNIIHATDVLLTREVFGSLDVTTNPSRIDSLETTSSELDNRITSNTEDITLIDGRVTANEGSITNITDTFVADIRIDLADSETAASTDADGNFDATADERHAARLVSAERIAELISGALEADPAIPSFPNDPASFSEGDVWYNQTADTIRYATSDTNAVTVAGVEGDSITRITGPVATSDGGLTYTAFRVDGTTISWTTRQGTTPTPGTAHFFANINPHTISQTSIATDVDVTVSLGVTGTGFNYQGFSNVVASDPDSGLSTTTPVPSSGTTATFTFTVNAFIESTIAISGSIDYTDADGNALTHNFTVTTQVTASTPNHIYFDYAAPGTDTFNLATFTDTGVVATDGAEFTFTANDVTDGDLVIAYPSSLNPIGIFGPFGQYLPDPGEGLQTPSVFTGGGVLSIYTLGGFERAGRLTFREL